MDKEILRAAAKSLQPVIVFVKVRKILENNRRDTIRTIAKVVKENIYTCIQLLQIDPNGRKSSQIQMN